MSATNNGGPAFPRPNFHSDTHYTAPAQDGMSLRDWLAGQALFGIVAYNTYQVFGEEGSAKSAFHAYEIADAMLAERAKSQ